MKKIETEKFDWVLNTPLVPTSISNKHWFVFHLRSVSFIIFLTMIFTSFEKYEVR